MNAYQGKDPYIFISYAHKDKNIIYPFILELQKCYNVWYDEGIHYGMEWEAEVAEKLKNCCVFLFALTENSLESENCKDELYHARERKKPFINIVFKQDTVLPDWFSFRYGRFQMCLLYTFKNAQSAVDDLEQKCDLLSLAKHDSEVLCATLSDEPIHNLVENEICICLDINSKYSSHITVYDRIADKRSDTYYKLTDSFITQLEKNIRDLFLCICGLNDITMRIKWATPPGEYACHETDPGVAHIISDGRVDFEISYLETIENKHFNSFEFIISGSQMRLLLYKDGQYAFKGLSPDEPLSFFRIDQEELLRISHLFITFCNPGKKPLFQNKIYNKNSQINNSGCVYFVENYFVE